MPTRRLEDRIRELCAQALTAQGSELDPTFSALQHALREHNDRLRKLAAAKLTTWRLRNGEITIAAPASRTLFECILCSKPIPLEESKVSAEGQPMHEECYLVKVSLRNQLPQQAQVSS